jgi:hypothetical protein
VQALPAFGEQLIRLDCPGGLVLRLLHNRCLDWMGIAKYLYGLGGGPALSPSTIGMIGHGRKAPDARPSGRR